MANKEIKSLKITDKNGQSYTLSVPKNGANVDTSDFALKSELDEFDPEAYKSELNTIADEVKGKMSVFDSLTELDLDELKTQLKMEIKTEILAELRG